MVFYDSYEAYDGAECAVMLGKFDGLHLGHRSLLKKMSSTCGDLRKVILAIDTDTEDTKEIFSFDEKLSVCEALGLDSYVSLKFTDAIKTMAPEAFVKDILIEKLRTKLICVGEGFRFGYNRCGDTELLRKTAGTYGTEVAVVPAVTVQGTHVSSTEIRKRISEGKTEQVEELLGQPYFISGFTKEGRKLGRVMHFPTLNLAPGKRKLLPPFGVYRTFTEYEGKIYPSVTNVGVNPSVKEDGLVSVETHLLRMPEQGIGYGDFIKVSFTERIRAERKFASIEELSEQIRMDKETVEKTIYKP